MTTKAKTGLIVALLVIFAAGVAGWYFTKMSKCLAAGGGANFIPPETIAADKETPLDLTLNTWGSNSCIDKQYWQDNVPRGIFTNVQCHYRVSGNPEYTAQKMTLVTDKAEEASYAATYRCVIPAQAEAAGKQLEYFFDYGWPDDIHDLQQKPIPIQ